MVRAEPELGRSHRHDRFQHLEAAEGEVRIIGSKSRLLPTLVAGSGISSAPTLGLKWRRGRDSNPRTLAGRRFSRPVVSTAHPPLRYDEVDP